MGGIIAKRGTSIQLGTMFYLTGLGGVGAHQRANPANPKVLVVDGAGALVFGPQAMNNPGNVPVGAVEPGMWDHQWAIPGGQALGHYRIYYYDEDDPAMTNVVADPASEELWIVDKDFDNIFSELRAIEDNTGGAGWNAATHNLVANYNASAAAAADAALAKTAAQLARDRLGADGDSFPVSTQTKYLAGVSLGAPVAGSIGKLLQDLSAGLTGVTLAAITSGVWNEPKAGHTTPGTYGNDLPKFLGIGAGGIFVDHNTGGADNLQFRNSATLAGVQEGVVRIFLKTDWDAGNRTVNHMKAWWSTDANGRAVNGCFLSAAVYTAAAYRTRSGSLIGIRLKTKDFTVA